MAAKAHEKTDATTKTVVALYSFGVPQSQIAGYIGIDSNTLRKYYLPEMKVAKTGANAKVAQFLFNSATGQALKEGAQYGDCLRAAMFWAKTQMQWREKQHINLTSSDGSMSPKPAITAVDAIEAAKQYQKIMGKDE